MVGICLIENPGHDRAALQQTLGAGAQCFLLFLRLGGGQKMNPLFFTTLSGVKIISLPVFLDPSLFGKIADRISFGHQVWTCLGQSTQEVSHILFQGRPNMDWGNLKLAFGFSALPGFGLGKSADAGRTNPLQVSKKTSVLSIRFPSLGFCLVFIAPAPFWMRFPFPTWIPNFKKPDGFRWLACILEGWIWFCANCP